MELFRRSLTDSVSFLFANRQKTAPAEWALSVTRAEPVHPTIPQAGSAPPIPMAASAPPKPASWPKTDEEIAASSRPPGPWDTLPEVAGGEPSKKPETYNFEGAWKPPTGAMGLKTDNAPAGEPVSAFDRPQPVIVVGPNPLPVSFDFSKISGGAASPTVPRGERGERGEGGGFMMARAIGAKFLAVLGPLYALSTILNQTNSGMGVFGKAVNVLGATLAPLVLPVFVLLAAGVLSVAEILQSKLIPALGGFYRWMLKVGIPIAEEKVGKTADAVDLWSTLIEGKLPKGKQADTFARNAIPGGDNASDASKWLNRKILDLGAWGSRQVGKDDSPWKAARDNWWAGGGGTDKEKTATTNPDGSPKKSVGDLFKGNLDAVMKSLAMSMGPKASYSSLGEVGKQAQLAALNQDPIEAKQLQVMIQSLQELQKVVSELQKDDAKTQISRQPR